MSGQSTKKPDLYAYAVRETGDNQYFTKIGAVFKHAKGGGFTVDLSAYPVDNKIVIFPPKEDDKQEPVTP